MQVCYYVKSDSYPHRPQIKKCKAVSTLSFLFLSSSHEANKSCHLGARWWMLRNVSSKILCDKVFAFTWTFTHFSESVRRDREPNTKMRACIHNQKDAVQMPSETLNAKMVPGRVARRCATVAASKIKIMSNLKETISGPEKTAPSQCFCCR
jgi:hypothetical protein